MEPIPETADALEELTRYGDRAIAGLLWRVGRGVELVVPEVVGLSLSIVEGNLTLTLASSSLTLAGLDAAQFLEGGPCEDALHRGTPGTFRSDAPDDEARWQLFARACSTVGVEATLSIPVLRDDTVVAAFNIYASTPDAFTGHTEELVVLCGGWEEGIVHNADLDFTTRFAAAETLERLRGEDVVDLAVGLLMSRWQVSEGEAERRLRRAAARAGLTDAQTAQLVVDLLSDPE